MLINISLLYSNCAQQSLVLDTKKKKKKIDGSMFRRFPMRSITYKFYSYKKLSFLDWTTKEYMFLAWHLFSWIHVWDLSCLFINTCFWHDVLLRIPQNLYHPLWVNCQSIPLMHVRFVKYSFEVFEVKALHCWMNYF